MFENGGGNFSDVVLAVAADLLAVMVERFVPQSNTCIYSAKSIAEYLQGLQFGNSSTLYAEIDSLKLGLMIRSFRTALSHAFPGLFEFDKSQASDSTISKGAKKFKYGFMIKFMSSSPPLSASKNKLMFKSRGYRERGGGSRTQATGKNSHMPRTQHRTTSAISVIYITMQL